MEQLERDTRSDDEAEYEDEEVDPRIQVGSRRPLGRFSEVFPPPWSLRLTRLTKLATSGAPSMMLLRLFLTVESLRYCFRRRTTVSFRRVLIDHT